MFARTAAAAVLFVLAPVTLGSAWAQNQLAWQQTFGTGATAERPSQLRIDALGNVVIGGEFLSSTTAYDWLVIKYDAAGTFQWSRTYDESGQSDYFGDVQVDTNGDVYVTGETRSPPLDFRMGLFRYDASGNLVWSRFSGMPGATARGKAICLDGAGGIHVSGSTSGPGGGMTFWKYDTAGNPVWQTTTALPGVYPLYFAPTLVRDSAGSLITSAGALGVSISVATAKVDASGNPVWMVAYYPPGSDEAWAGSVAVDAHDDIYVAGSNSTAISGSPFNGFLLKYDANGVLQWARTLSGVPAFSSYLNAVAVDGHGDIVVAGSVSMPDSISAAVLRKYDALGNLKWSRTYGDTPVSSQGFSRIALDAGGDIVAAGSTNAAGEDAFVARYDASGELEWTTVFAAPTVDYGGPVALGASGSILLASTVEDDVRTMRLEPLTSVFCFGDGSGTACPCGNASTPFERAGCLNSVGTAGRLHDTGAPSLSSPTLRLAATGMTNSSALYFQGTAEQNGGAGSVFGDGLRCAGGINVRLATRMNAAGASSYPAAGEPSISTLGAVTSPGTRTYQVWYRNVIAFCTSDPWNLTNGVRVSWVP